MSSTPNFATRTDEPAFTRSEGVISESKCSQISEDEERRKMPRSQFPLRGGVTATDCECIARSGDEKDLPVIWIELSIGKGCFEIELKDFVKYRKTYLGGYVLEKKNEPDKSPQLWSENKDTEKKERVGCDAMSATALDGSDHSETIEAITDETWNLRPPSGGVKSKGRNKYWHYRIDRSEVLFVCVLQCLDDPGLITLETLTWTPVVSAPWSCLALDPMTINNIGCIQMKDILAEVQFYDLTPFLSTYNDDYGYANGGSTPTPYFVKVFATHMGQSLRVPIAAFTVGCHSVSQNNTHQDKTGEILTDLDMLASVATKEYEKIRPHTPPSKSIVVSHLDGRIIDRVIIPDDTFTWKMCVCVCVCVYVSEITFYPTCFFYLFLRECVKSYVSLDKKSFFSTSQDWNFCFVDDKNVWKIEVEDEPTQPIPTFIQPIFVVPKVAVVTLQNLFTQAHFENRKQFFFFFFFLIPLTDMNCKCPSSMLIVLLQSKSDSQEWVESDNGRRLRLKSKNDSLCGLSQVNHTNIKISDSLCCDSACTNNSRDRLCDGQMEDKGCQNVRPKKRARPECGFQESRPARSPRFSRSTDMKIVESLSPLLPCLLQCSDISLITPTPAQPPLASSTSKPFEFSIGKQDRHISTEIDIFGLRQSEKKKVLYAKHQATKPLCEYCGKENCQKGKCIFGLTKNLGIPKNAPASCHKCKKKKKDLVFCTQNSDNKFGKCNKKFCESCLKKYSAANIRPILEAQMEYRSYFQKQSCQDQGVKKAKRKTIAHGEVLCQTGSKPENRQKNVRSKKKPKKHAA
ncbi:hypothetical protein RFI_03272 [Reticulomyxa filosa]|uniref:Uncharacterized protein n=1 Tax=Reticulomyxa filosa TaxID=46433 RepID=X6P6X0_RETFI|nr:hypothetical protein RFI_03272 [Reticulomyxa filosa]|eukprot:ETO33834.1 hypothetical protein RFI_03272 [Reticulomyxa filosa]